MGKTTLQIIATFIIVLLLQVIVFSRICLFNVAVPFVFVFAILRLPVSLSPSLVMLLAFLSGLFVDMFTNTPGMNALAATILAGLRRPVIKVFVNREDDLSSSIPSARNLGGFTYFKYTLTLILAYCVTVFIVESSTLIDISTTLLRILFSTLLTTVLVIAFDRITGEHTPDRQSNTL